MASGNSMDYAKPYEIMVGLWAGMASAYDPKGKYIESVPSRAAIYWKDANTICYRQDEEDSMESVLDARVKSVGHVVHINFDLHIKGKYCEGTNQLVEVDGREFRPGNYLFHLTAKDGSGQYYNNQYFLNPNERHIIGPYVDASGEIALVLAQSFTRLSYDVPKKLRRTV